MVYVSFSELNNFKGTQILGHYSIHHGIDLFSYKRTLTGAQLCENIKTATITNS